MTSMKATPFINWMCLWCLLHFGLFVHLMWKVTFVLSHAHVTYLPHTCQSCVPSSPSWGLRQHFVWCGSLQTQLFTAWRWKADSIHPIQLSSLQHFLFHLHCHLLLTLDNQCVVNACHPRIHQSISVFAIVSFCRCNQLAVGNLTGLKLTFVTLPLDNWFLSLSHPTKGNFSFS